MDSRTNIESGRAVDRKEGTKKLSHLIEVGNLGWLGYKIKTFKTNYVVQK